MMRARVGVGLVVALALFGAEAFAQNLAKRMFYGVNIGSQSLVSFNRNAGLGFSGEGLVGYRFSSRTGASFVLGYATLPFNFTKIKLRTSNAVYGNVLFDYEIVNQGKVHPYVLVGVGGLNYQGFKITGKRSKSRRSSVNGILGLGMRFLLTPDMALNLYGAYNRNSNDGIDAQKGGQDAFVSGRIGLALFRGGTEQNMNKELFVDRVPVENVPQEQTVDDTYKFSSNLAAKNEKMPSNGKIDVQEFIQLQSKTDELAEKIEKKEGEISTLRSQIGSKKSKASVLKTTAFQVRPRSSSISFSRAYEDALNSFYLKQYQEAIEKFNILNNEFPTHTLASNCYYWKGESHFGAGEYDDAIVAFTRVLGFSRSLKKDDALLSLGKCYIRLNRQADARESFQQLIKEYPGSEFVTKAGELLNKM